MERTEKFIGRATRRFPHSVGREDLFHIQTYGLARRNDGYVLLNLDTEKDEMAAKLYSAAGCTFYEVEWCYYHHTDETGKEYLYKIDPHAVGMVPPSLLEKANQYLRDAQVDVSDKAATEDVVKKMVVELRSERIASCVYGTRIMSRMEILADFDCMEEDQGIEISDKGLAKEYYPRPTSRTIAGYPAPGAMEQQDEEEKLYWSRIKKGKPIPPEVWKFLEDARRKWGDDGEGDIHDVLPGKE